MTKAPRRETLLTAIAVAAQLLFTAAAQAGGTPGYYGPQPVQQLPPVIVPAPPNPAQLFFTGIFDIVAAPIGLALNIITAPFTVAAPFQQPAPLAYTAPQPPIIVPQLPAPRYPKIPGWRAPEGHAGRLRGCYDELGHFVGQANPECTQ
jgi:hypothetical protein